MSGGTPGYLYMLHFASCVPNTGEYMEYKGKNDKVPFSCGTSSLLCKDGKVQVPTGPGLGIIVDPNFVKKARVVTG